MQLDERSNTLLKEIMLTPGIKITDLQKKLKLSRNQINYSVVKINDWLTSIQMPVLQKGRQSGMYVDPAVQESFPELVGQTVANDVVLTDLERKNLVVLMLLIREEPYSLFHLSSALKVSRNTVLHDLKGVATFMEPWGLEIHYTRRDGYYLLGDELKKRHLLIQLVHQLLQTQNGKQWFVDILGFQSEEFSSIRQCLERIETHLNIRFTDEKLDELPVTIACMFRRMKQQKKLDSYDVDVLESNVYHAVQEHLFANESLDERDLMFVTLQLLSSSVSYASHSQEEVPGLFAAIIQMLMNFEKMACVNLVEKDELVSRLYLHLKPAYYRMKYHLTMDNPLLQSVLEEHGELHHLVKKSAMPLVETFGFEIPENEMTYITMLVGSWLLRQGDEISTRKMAIVVCPNGISISKLLLESLRGLFPEIVFLDHVSLRDFVNYPLEYDLVFSTTFLRTDKKLFIVKPLLSNVEKYRLKMRVQQELNGYHSSQVNLDELMELIGKHVVISAKTDLKKALHDFFREKQAPVTYNEASDYKPSISEVLREIHFADEVDSWQEAIRLASKPLLASNSITHGYVDTMVDLFEGIDPYIVIAPKVAIPHASPESGVNRLAMSLLRLNKEVDFGGQPVRIFIVIAAIDRSTHLRALMQLNDLLYDQNNIDAILQANSKEEVTGLLKQYSIDRED